MYEELNREHLEISPGRGRTRLVERNDRMLPMLVLVGYW
jgi:hypothetical protein